MNREPPYYKQLDPAKQAGQQVNTIKTLDQYVEKVLAAEAPPKKKLTFEEWWSTFNTAFCISKTAAIQVWNAAQENK